MSAAVSKRPSTGSEARTMDAQKPPKKKRRVCELVTSLEKSRRSERRVFAKLIQRLREIYGLTSKFTFDFIKDQTLYGAQNTFETIGKELAQFQELLQWREQARGPTGMLSAKVDGVENFKQWEHHPIWVLCTPRTERTIETHGRTLNYAEGEFMTWGLPAADKFDRRIFKQYRLLFVVEKIKGGQYVQHRVKNLYMCLTKARRHDDRIYLVTWKHFMERVLSGQKVKTPVWCQRPQKH